MIQIRIWRFYVLNFIFPPSHAMLFYSVFLCLFPFLVPLSVSPLSSLFILFISVFSVRCFSYQFFFLRCWVSSFPSCASFLYPLLSVRSVLFPTLSLHIFPFVSHSLSSLINSTRACTGHKHELRSSPRAHVCCSQGPFPHSSLSSLTVDRALTSYKFPVC